MDRRYGWKKDSLDFRDKVLRVEEVANLPASIDWRHGMPVVYDQGQLGSCTANAIAAAHEFDQMKQGNDIGTPSRLFIYYNERVMEHSVNQDAGAQIRDGVKSINKQGVCPEAEWPYDITKFKERPTDQSYIDALKHQSLIYKSVIQTLAALKNALVSGFPVIFGFTVYDSFESQQVAKTGIVSLPKKSEIILGGHAVLLVGYDDSLYAGKGGWIVRNSWGTDWGQAGYFTMPYFYLTNKKLASDFWVINSVEV